MTELKLYGLTPEELEAARESLIALYELRDGYAKAKRRREVIDYSTIRAVCRECATAAGFVPKDKVVGVWIGECGICHERKPCTDLHHDWRRKKEGGAK